MDFMESGREYPPGNVMGKAGIAAMDQTRAISACFTGHRILASEKTFLDLRVKLAVHRLADQGFVWFLSGMAMGFDLLAAEAVLGLRDRLPVRLAAILPCPPEQYTAAWADGDRRRLAAILEQADRTVTVSPAYGEDCFLVRNRYLVEHSAYVLACLEHAAGGTAYTVHLAGEQGLPVWNLADPGVLG